MINTAAQRDLKIFMEHNAEIMDARIELGPNIAVEGAPTFIVTFHNDARAYPMSDSYTEYNVDTVAEILNEHLDTVREELGKLLIKHIYGNAIVEINANLAEDQYPQCLAQSRAGALEEFLDSSHWEGNIFVPSGDRLIFVKYADPYIEKDVSRLFVEYINAEPPFLATHKAILLKEYNKLKAAAAQEQKDNLAFLWEACHCSPNHLTAQ